MDRLLGEYRIPENSAAVDGAEYKSIRRGWFLGDQRLKEELLAAVNVQAGG